MTREEAEARCQDLAREHPDRATHRWFAREAGAGEWTVVKVPLPEGARIDPLTATTEAKPRPPQPDDPRPSNMRDVPPFGAA